MLFCKMKISETENPSKIYLLTLPTVSCIMKVQGPELEFFIQKGMVTICTNAKLQKI